MAYIKPPPDSSSQDLTNRALEEREETDKAAGRLFVWKARRFVIVSSIALFISFGWSSLAYGIAPSPFDILISCVVLFSLWYDPINSDTADMSSPGYLGTPFIGLTTSNPISTSPNLRRLIGEIGIIILIIGIPLSARNTAEKQRSGLEAYCRQKAVIASYPDASASIGAQTSLYTSTLDTCLDRGYQP